MIKIAFFDSKPYDEKSFAPYFGKEYKAKFFETKLNEDTVELTKGFDAICIFVNDDVNQAVIDKLHKSILKLFKDLVVRALYLARIERYRCIEFLALGTCRNRQKHQQHQKKEL